MLNQLDEMGQEFYVDPIGRGIFIFTHNAVKTLLDIFAFVRNIDLLQREMKDALIQSDYIHLPSVQNDNYKISVGDIILAKGKEGKVDDITTLVMDNEILVIVHVEFAWDTKDFYIEPFFLKDIVYGNSQVNH